MLVMGEIAKNRKYRHRADNRTKAYNLMLH